MRNIIKVHWVVDDGYVNPGEQTTSIDVEFELGLSEDEWNAMSEDEQRIQVDDIVQQDFEQKISYYIKRIETL